MPEGRGITAMDGKIERTHPLAIGFSFRRSVHTRTQLRDQLECPALPGTKQLMNLFLPFQIVFLVVTGHTGIGGNGAAYLLRRMKLVWPKPHKVVASSPPPAVRSSGWSLPSRSQRCSFCGATSRNSAAS